MDLLHDPVQDDSLRFRRFEGLPPFDPDTAQHAHRILVHLSNFLMTDGRVKPREEGVVPRKERGVFVVVDVQVRMSHVAPIRVLLETLLDVIDRTLKRVLFQVGGDDPECRVATIGLKSDRQIPVRDICIIIKC